MKILVYIFFFFLSAEHLLAQNLQLIQNQWNSIQKAKTSEEKLLRNCRMSRQLLGVNAYDFETNQLIQNPNLNEIEGFSDLLEEQHQIRILSWHFALDKMNYQYNLEFVCRFKNKTGIAYSSGSGWCNNDLGLNCDPCNSTVGRSKEWVGAYYENMTSAYEDSLLFLHMKGKQFHASDTQEVYHIFSVSPNCKVDFIKNTEVDAVR